MEKDLNGYIQVVYHVIQCVCFGIMAGLIMRLKLFFTPHLCIVAAILANTKVSAPFVLTTKLLIYFFLTIILRRNFSFHLFQFFEDWLKIVFAL